MDLLEWLQEWYLSHCDGDWEHSYENIRISTIDNPGWAVAINLKETRASGVRMPPYRQDTGDDDWVSCKVEDDKFIGHGDPGKLTTILELFRLLVTEGGPCAGMGNTDHIKAHKHSSKHRAEIEESALCGCFSCLSIYAPECIEDWTDTGATALCPDCGIDSVIGSASGYPIEKWFLDRMRREWF